MILETHHKWLIENKLSYDKITFSEFREKERERGRGGGGGAVFQSRRKCFAFSKMFEVNLFYSV